MPKFAAFKAYVFSMLHVDWAEVKQLFLREGLFWLAEYVLIAMAAYSISHLFRRRTLLSKPLCGLIGHEWQLLERDAIRYSSNRDIVGELAGSRAKCSRCAREWNDLPGRSELDARRRAEQPPRQPRAPRATPAAPRPAPVPVTPPTPAPRRQTASKKGARKTPAKATTRFDRELDLLEVEVEKVIEEQPKTEAQALPEEQTPETPADTGSPTDPSSPEGSEPS